MNKIDFLKSAGYFFPDLEHKVLVSLNLNDLYRMLKNHYIEISSTIAKDVEKAYVDRGYLKTVGGRKATPTPKDESILEWLINESLVDIYEAIIPLFNCQIELPVAFTIYERDKVPELKKKIDEKIDSFHLRIKSNVELEITDETAND